MKDIIKAARRDRISNLIEDIPTRLSFENNEILCSKCNVKLTKDNVGGIKKEKGKIIFFCDKHECLKDC